MLTVGSLFAGIGGFDLGLERAGMRTVWFCEQDPFCQRVLAKHWPGVPCYPDVRTLVADAECIGRGIEGVHAVSGKFAAQGNGRQAGGASGEGDVGGSGGFLPVPVPYVDVLAGGFPCQDLSYAGRGAGIEGERSGLWSEFARLVGELRPRYVLVENVPALLGRGLGRVLGDLAEVGYDAEWDCLPASAFGAPHRRDRVWLVAYPDTDGRGLEVGSERDSDPARPGLETPQRNDADGLHADVADPAGEGRQPRRPAGEALPRPGEVERSGRRSGSDGSYWEFEPDVGRVAHGIPARVDRLRALGNSLVPQIAEWIGTRILEAEQMRAAA